MSEASASHAQEAEVREVVRLSPAIYRALEKKVGVTTILDRQCTDPGVDAGYKLGVQHVLWIIRQELVVE